MTSGSSVTGLINSAVLRGWGVALFLFSCVLLSSCENDLRDVEKIASRKAAIPVDISRGVTIVYSDSAVVKAKLLSPELHHYNKENLDKEYFEFPKGVKIIFLDEETQEEKTNVVADYAIRRQKQQVVELRKNVVVTNKNGDTFTSDELIWDETKRLFYSNQLVNIRKPDGTDIIGSGFRSDESFLNPEIDRATGNFATGDNLTY